MIEQLKKLSVIVTIAILFTVLVFSISDLIVEGPNYSEYCNDFRYSSPRDIAVPNDCPDAVVPGNDFMRNCHADGGYVVYDYDSDGCAIDYECNTCNVLYNEARSTHRMVMFIVSSLLGLVAVLVGLHLKPKTEILEWVYSGFIIGGLVSIFIGTVNYFGDMNRFVRPLVMIAEIILVIWVGFKATTKTSKKTKKQKK